MQPWTTSSQTGVGRIQNVQFVFFFFLGCEGAWLPVGWEGGGTTVELLTDLGAAERFAAWTRRQRPRLPSLLNPRCSSAPSPTQSAADWSGQTRTRSVSLRFLFASVLAFLCACSCQDGRRRCHNFSRHSVASVKFPQLMFGKRKKPEHQNLCLVPAADL